MWEAIASILMSENILKVVFGLSVLVVLLVILVKLRVITISTEHVTIGDKAADLEQTIIRNQITFAHLYCESLEGKIVQVKSELRYNGYFAKWVLERVFDKIVEWITYNHITDNEPYIHIKQEEICNLVYSLGVDEEFKTEEFRDRMRNWTEEVIREIIKIRKVYTKQYANKEKLCH